MRRALWLAVAGAFLVPAPLTLTYTIRTRRVVPKGTRNGRLLGVVAIGAAYITWILTMVAARVLLSVAGGIPLDEALDADTDTTSGLATIGTLIVCLAYPVVVGLLWVRATRRAGRIVEAATATATLEPSATGAGT